MEAFKYRPINLDELTLRLVILRAGLRLDIKVDILHATLDEEEIIPYEAVSYVWGSQEKPKVVYVQGKRLPVTNNLWDVLYNLQHPEHDRYLWVDAICIDQENTSERNHQVQQMGLIYNRAERVLFYLGPPTLETNIVMDILSELQQHCRNQYWKPEDHRWNEAWLVINPYWAEQHAKLWTSFHEGMTQLLSSPWFCRIWILQEVANSRSALVYCGTRFIPARFFALGPRLIGVEVKPHQQAVLDMMPTKPRTTSIWSSGQDLYLLLRQLEEAEAQDDRDKIFALLGMCAGGNGNGSLVADYSKHIKDVLRETIAYMCFCKMEDIPDMLCANFQNLRLRLKDIHDILVAYFMRISRFDSLASLLKNRGDYITASPTTLKDAAQKEDAEEKELLAFLKQRIKQGRQEFSDPTEPFQEAKVDTNDIKNSSEVYFVYAKDNEITTISVLQRVTWDNNGLTPLWWGRQHQNTITQTTLLDYEAIIENYTHSHVMMALHFAAVVGADILVWQLLDNGANIEARSLENQTPLCLAASRGNETTVKLLLDRGANAEAEGRYSRTPLFMATSKGHNTIVTLLLDRGVDIEARYWNNMTPLSLALIEGHETTVKLLLNRGANIEAEDKNSQTPLSLAASRGHDTIVKLLLDRGANIEAGCWDNATPLSLAVIKGHETTVKLLLDRGANIEAAGQDNEISLLLAIRRGYETIVNLLLDRGANIEAAGQNNQTPLCLAASLGDETIVKPLLQRGANIEARDLNSQTPLSLAASWGHGGITKLLLDNGADIEIRDQHSQTPLSLAVSYGNETTVRVLLDRGANIEAEDNQKRTPLSLAAGNGYYVLVELFLNLNANIEARDENGLTPLSVAGIYGYKKIVELLIDRGADVKGKDINNHTSLEQV